MNRYATQDDANNYYNVNVGDLIIEDMTSHSPRGYVYIDENYEIDGEKLKLNEFPGQNNKIALKGQTNGRMGLFFHPNVKGPLVNGVRQPLVITNFDGQRKITPNGQAGGYIAMIVAYCSLDLDFSYNPEKQTGDPNFRGIYHPKGWAWMEERTGLWVDNQWRSTLTNLSVYVKGNYGVRMRNTAAGNGGFCTMFKFELTGTGTTMEGAKAYDWKCFDLQDGKYYDTHGEGIYVMSTQPVAHKVDNWIIKNVACVRNGAEDFQLGHLGIGGIMENCIGYAPGMHWLDQFKQHQDNGRQFNPRCGGSKINKNIFAGGTSKYFQWINEHKHSDEYRALGLPFTISNNYFGYARGQGVYISNADGGLATFGEMPTPLILDNNYLGPNDGSYNDELFPINRNFETMVINNFNTTNAITISNNKYFQGLDLVGLGNTPNVTISGNIAVTEEVNPTFPRMGLPLGFDPRNITHYFNRVLEHNHLLFQGYSYANTTTPVALSGPVSLGPAQVVTSVNPLPVDVNNSNTDVYPQFIGQLARLYDTDNPYDNFSVHTIVGVDQGAGTITLGAAVYVKNGGTYANVSLDKEGAFIKWKEPKWCYLKSKFYKFIGTSLNYYETAGKQPDLNPDVWEHVQWDDDGVMKDMSPDDPTLDSDDPYYGMSVYIPTEEEVEQPPPPVELGNRVNPRKLARKRVLEMVLGGWD